MKRLVLTTPDEDMSKVVLSVEEVPVPKPRSGELLIKVSLRHSLTSLQQMLSKRCGPGCTSVIGSQCGQIATEKKTG